MTQDTHRARPNHATCSGFARPIQGENEKRSGSPNTYYM